MGETQVRDTYKYALKLGEEVLMYGVTFDLVRREANYQERFPGCRLEQIGTRVTRSSALRWGRKENRRLFDERNKG